MRWLLAALLVSCSPHPVGCRQKAFPAGDGALVTCGPGMERVDLMAENTMLCCPVRDR